MNQNERQVKAVAALALLVPAPSIGAGTMLFLAPGPLGTAVSGVCKIWLLLLPLAWLVWVDKGKPVWPRFTSAGMFPATVLGAAIFAAMLVAFYAIGLDWIDVEAVRAKAAQAGLDTVLNYCLLFAFLVPVNSLLEEYVWRWFVFRKCQALMPGYLPVVATAALFTLHHIVAVSAWAPWQANLLASLGVFLGSAIWSWLYLEYSNLWAAYVCHIFADLAIFIMGWHLFFEP